MQKNLNVDAKVEEKVGVKVGTKMGVNWDTTKVMQQQMQKKT